MEHPLTPADLGELERMLVEAGVGTSADLSRAKQEGRGLGLFIRSLVGLDREAAKQAFGQFLSGKVQSANQIEFINLIIDHLTEHGVMDPGLLYESPFTDINRRDPRVFTSEQVDGLISLLQRFASERLLEAHIMVTMPKNKMPKATLPTYLPSAVRMTIKPSHFETCVV